MKDIATAKLIAEQEKRGNRICDICARFPKAVPRSGDAASMYAKIVETDRTWLDFLNVHEELLGRSDIDGSHQYFAQNFKKVVEEAVKEINEFAVNHISILSKAAIRFDMVNRPAGFANETMFTDDGTLKQSALSLDPSIITTNPSRNREQEEDTPNLQRNFANSVQDLFNSSAHSHSSSSSSNLILTMQSIQGLILELEDMNDQEEDFAPKANVLKTRFSTALSLHQRLMSTDGYNPTSFFQLEVSAQRMLTKVEAAVNKKSEHPKNKQTNIKVPKIDMPKFSGDYTKWRSFRDLFLQTLVKHDFSPVERLVYLRSALSPECAKLISHLPLTNDSYDIAWDVITNRFEDPRHIMKTTIDRLFSLEKSKLSCPSSLKKLHDAFYEHMQAVIQVGENPMQLNTMLFHQILLNKLDADTYQLYEQSLDDCMAPQTAISLLQFILRRSRAMERSATSKSAVTPPVQSNAPKWKRTTALSASVSKKPSPKPIKGSQVCTCKENHPLVKCPKFIALTPRERLVKIRDAGRCINCLASNHALKDCKSSKCRDCDRSHHTMLHFGNVPKVAGMLTSVTEDMMENHVFLGTVTLMIQNSDGVFIRARALLDSGSQVSVMSEDLLQRTGLKPQVTALEIVGMGHVAAKATKRTVINIASPNSEFETSLEVYILKKLTCIQPCTKVDIAGWNIPDDIQLADSKFNIPASIDIVIGSELFYPLMKNGLKSLGDSLPYLQNTVFGWMVVGGNVVGLEPTQVFAGMGIAQNVSLKDSLTKFWDVEERGAGEVPMTDANLACEQFFEDTTIRGEDGRFTVKLQFTVNPDDEIGKSLETATRRFYSLERKLVRDSEMRRQYNEFMSEYESLGHMEKLDHFPQGIGCYYIPHHAVLNPSSSTTKFRVVFDASAKTSTNTALNELMATGPMLQDDLFTIMTRFRMMQYVFSADIAKMYRQINVAPEDQRWQLIIWRKSPDEPLQCYRLKTVTYGTKCASYLAIKTLQHLAQMEKEKYPLASKIACRDFNVDDIMTGSNDLAEAINMQSQLVPMLSSAGMYLHKWCANHPLLLKRIPADKKEVTLEIGGEDEETKALGMKWLPFTDAFMLNYQPKPAGMITKRTVLSEIAKLFDPLGLVSPIIVRAKAFIQELWALEYDWDVSIPDHMCAQWISFRRELHDLTMSVSIRRHAVIKEAVNRELHIFSDASEMAYGANVYVRSSDKNNKVETHLLCSKSRVAPVNKLSVPRLELCAAKLSVELAQKIMHKLGVKIDKIVYWTDSEIVLAWLATTTPLKTFVANRISEIKRHSKIIDWRYVETKHNPADLTSRGCSSSELKNNRLWWNGPSFLLRPENTWPSDKASFVRDATEEKRQKTMLLATVPEPNVVGQINHGNSIVSWQRILAYCLKFGTKRDASSLVKTTLSSLGVADLKKAMTAILRYAQAGPFFDDIKWLQKGKPEKTQFKTLTPILDTDGILRVGGRLQASDLPFEQRHPVILPYNSEVTKLILQRIHLDNMHVGPQALLGLARQKYWIIKGKAMAKTVVDTCALCCKAKPKLLEQVMGPLPKDRVTPNRPFQTVGIDFAGPIDIHQKGRGQRILKAYICVFVCFVTKAVHLEAATDLSTASFLRCLKRFIARRGLPHRIYSDNATNFRGMNNQLLDLADQMNSDEFKEKLARYCDSNEIEWRFIPPKSPHFGGLWEAAVKSAKFLLIRTIHNHHLIYDELVTLLAEIEAILNSRPISSLSDDPNDLQPLTAGHFLIGAPMRNLNDDFIPNLTPIENWAKLVAIRNEFWKKWRKEYLHELQAKGKWRAGSKSIKVGTLVTIKDNNTPPLQWRMGRVESVIPDKDGIVRVVRLKTSSGQFIRAIHELSPIPSGNSLEPETQILEKSSLNVNAPEFHFNAKPKDKVTKPTRKRDKKPKNATVRADPSRTTRSGRSFGILRMPQTILYALMLFAILLSGAIAKPCNTTTFTTSPGLYYESLGMLSLSNDEWRLVCHMDRNKYANELNQLNNLVDDMASTCFAVHPKEHCQVVIDQLRDQIGGMTSRNELITGFAERNRQKREVFRLFSGTEKNGAQATKDDTQSAWISIFGDKTKITSLYTRIQKCEARLSKAITRLAPYVFGTIPQAELKVLEALLQDKENRKIATRVSNEIISSAQDLFGSIPDDELQTIEAQLQEKMNEENENSPSNEHSRLIHHRVRRGWFDGIGKGAHEVFGILDVDDANHYDNEIVQLKGNEAYLKQLISNQTTIQEITSNIIRRDEQKLERVVAMLAQGTRDFAQKDERGKELIFSTLSIQTLHAIQRYQEMQSTIINMLTSVFHGKVPPTLITPSQLRNHLAIISSHIDHNLMVPGSDQRNYVSQLYKMLSAKVHVTEANILIEIRIPLISREQFQLYHIVPVPFKQNDQLHIISPSANYIAINLKQDHYYLMKTEEKQHCLVYDDESIICKQHQPLHNVQTNHTRCEIAIIMEPKHIHRACKIVDVNFAQSWTSLAKTNHHLYAVQDQTDINIICGTRTQHCSLVGTGIFQLDENCIIKSGTLEISSKREMHDDEPIVMVVPATNITEHLPYTQSNPSPPADSTWNDFRDNNPEWDTLRNALDQQIHNANLELPTIHDIHHYSFMYTLTAILIVSGIAYIFRRKIRQTLCNRPSPLNRRIMMSQLQSQAIAANNQELHSIRATTSPPAPVTVQLVSQPQLPIYTTPQVAPRTTAQ